MNEYGVWSSWASKYGFLSLPASECDVSVYLVSIIQKHNSFATVDEAFYAIKWAHELAGYNSKNPWSSFFVKSVSEAAHRIMGHSVSKKEPITPEILKQLVNIYGCDNANLYQLRSMLMCLLAYAGFLRFYELVNRRSDIGFNPDHIALFIETSKTDIYRDGNWCMIAKTACDTCPVKMLERYIDSAGIQQDSDEFIFRSLTFYKSNKSYKLRGLEPLSYSRTRELLHEMVDCIGLNKKLYGLHSLRSGGASSDANGGGTLYRLFKRHGRWRSERAKDMYVKDDIEKILLVSKCLGI